MITENEISKVVEATLKSVKSEKITLKEAKRLIVKVEKKAAEMGVNAVVAVGTNEGNVIAVECMDDAFIASYDIAVNKVFTSAALKMSTKKLSTLAQPGESLYGIQFTNGGRIVIFGGGVTLMRGDKIVGALGVSGGSEEQDTFLASYGEKIFFEEF